MEDQQISLDFNKHGDDSIQAFQRVPGWGNVARCTEITMAGCTKKSKRNTHSAKMYKLQNKAETNKQRKAVQLAKFKAKQDNCMITPKGTARSQRRADWLSAIEGNWTDPYRKSFQDYEQRL